MMESHAVRRPMLVMMRRNVQQTERSQGVEKDATASVTRLRNLILGGV